VVRRAIVVLAVVAAPATLMTMAAADAGAGRPAPPLASGGAAPAVAQADGTRKVRPAAARPASRRGKGWKSDDAATPPSPETAPAVSASLRNTVATSSAHAAETASAGARAPPA
jgi:hypothetical protein